MLVGILNEIRIWLTLQNTESTANSIVLLYYYILRCLRYCLMWKSKSKTFNQLIIDNLPVNTALIVYNCTCIYLYMNLKSWLAQKKIHFFRLRLHCYDLNKKFVLFLMFHLTARCPDRATYRLSRESKSLIRKKYQLVVFGHLHSIPIGDTLQISR